MMFRSAVLVFMTTLVSAASLPVTGPHKVDHSALRWNDSVRSRPISAEVWYPQDRSSAPLPLLLFAPGFGNKPVDYMSQLEDLASHGYVVVGIDPVTDSLDSFEARATLWAEDILLAKEQVLASSFKQMINADLIGAFGHSLGGRAAAAACLLDPAIRACLNQDGGNDDVQLQRPYWPITGRKYSGAFAMVDWFDPGLDDGDLRSMNTTLQKYAAARLVPSTAAVDSYRAAQRGGYRVTILTPGMRHTAFTDSLWANASSDSQRVLFADYLRQVRVITQAFFDFEFERNPQDPFCRNSPADLHTQCFAPAVK